MAVRWQLWELLRNGQPRGTVTVERRLPAAALVPQLPPSLLPAAEAVSPPRRQGPLPEDCAVFQCRGCWAVLGDSLHLCVQHRQLGLLVCFRVTNDVACEDSLMIGLEGPFLGCAYSALACRSCSLTVGCVLYSASVNLAYLRGFFCFFEDSILCYLLKNNIIIEASKMNFSAVTLKHELQKLKEKLVEMHIRIELLMKKLEELKQKNSLVQMRSSASNAVGLPPGFAIVRVK